MKHKKNTIFYKIIAVLIIVFLNISDFLFVGSSAISYAIDKKKTNNPNVEFSTYFLNESNEKVEKCEAEIDNGDLILYVDIEVKKEGYFNGEIKLDDCNFKIKPENLDTNLINNISENTVTLNQINAGTTATIPLKIEAITSENINIYNLNKKSNIQLLGEYVNSETVNEKKHIEINGTASVEIEWKSSANTQSELNTNIITNALYKTETEKRVVQLLINSQISNNNYPIKSTILEVEVPDSVEDVKVHSRSNRSTNSQIDFNESNYVYNKEQNKLIITLLNEDENNISWNKNVKDSIVVTFLFDKEENVQNKSIITKSTIKTYDDKEFNSQAVTEIKDEIDGIVSFSIGSSENSIYKGKIYTGEERIYYTNTIINVDYLDIVENINLKENASEYLLNEEKIGANTLYKETKINKAEFLKLFGEDGYITITTSDDSIQINKDSETDEEGNIIVKYLKQEEKIEINTSKPITLGTLKIENTKAILNKNLNREDVNNLKYLNENILASYNSQEEKKNEYNIELKNTSTNATLNVNAKTLSTTESNKKVKFTVVLENNSEDKDLYKNPNIKVALPKQVKDISAKCKVLYGNGLELADAKISTENGHYMIDIQLSGEQQTYNTETVEGTTIIIYADIELDKLAVNSEEQFTLNYTNEIATNYTDNNEKSVNVSIVANTGIITTNSILEYGIETVGNEGTKEIPLEILTESKNATVNISTINNEETNIKDVEILGNFPTRNSDNVGITLTSGINVISDKVSAKIYYSENENATSDINDVSNGWKTTPNIATSRKYLIKIDEMEIGEKFEANYPLNIPEQLHYNMNAEETYNVTYKVTDNLKDASATKLSLTTGAGPEIRTELKASIGGEEIKDGDEVNSGEVIKYAVTIENIGNAPAENVNVEAQIPQNTTYVKYIKNVSNIVEDVDETDETEEQAPDAEEEKTVDEEGFYIEEDNNGEDTDIKDHSMEGAEEDLYNEVKIEGNTITKTIASIKAGEKITLVYEVKINEKIENETKIENKVKTTCKDIKVNNSITNIVNKAKISLKLYMIQRASDVLEAGSEYIYLLDVKNLDNNNLKNIDISINNNELFKILEIEQYGSEEENILELKDNNTFTIKQLSANSTEQFMISLEAVEGNGNNEATLSAVTVVDNKKYKSNQITEKVKARKIELDIQSKNSGESIKSGEGIIYNVKVKNTGDISIEDLKIEQQLSTYLTVKNITINGNEVKYEKEDNKDTEALENTYKIYVKEPLKKEQELNINIETTTDSEIHTSEDVQLVSMVSAYDEVLLAKTEQINHILEAYDFSKENEKLEGNAEEESEDLNEDENKQNKDKNSENKDIVENKDNGSNKKDSNDSSNVDTKTFSITGTAWIDKNENGKKDTDEEKISGVKVKLINLQNNSFAVNASGEEITTTTSENGFYSLTKIPKGRYVVIFEYDKDKYVLTTFKAEGTQDNNNSDVENVTITINGEEHRVASTDELKIIDNNLTNIDIGLAVAKTFDFELSKTISKVTVTNNSGNQIKNYNDAKLAKVEVKAKELQGTTVVVEYKIKVTNTGEIAGYVKNVVDYRPADLNFNSNLNKDWYQSGEYIYSTSLANTKIEAGETKELTLVLTKNMTESNTGLVNNTAEIKECFNNLGISDIDSTPANKQKTEDDMGSCDLIISVKTGAAVSYIVFTLSIIIALAAGAYIVGKRVLRKRIDF